MTFTAANEKLSVYGGTSNLDDGNHLDGVIVVAEDWKRKWLFT